MKFEWGLLENAIDSLHEAVRRLAGEVDRRDMKHAILNLGTGLELIYKERLRIEDWKLLFSDPKEAEEAVFANGDFQSASIWKTFDRLEDAGVEIAADERKHVEALRERRNRLEHFQINESSDAVVAVTSQGLSMALDFFGRELDGEAISDALGAEIAELREALPELREFVEHRLKQIRPALEDAERTGTVIECPHCFEAAAIPGDGLRCLFCGFAVGLEDAERTAGEWAWAVLGLDEYRLVKEGGEPPVHRCVECDQVAMVDRGTSGDMQPSTRYVCLACGNAWPETTLEQCAKCGELFDSSGEMTVCAECFSGAISGPD
jgi:hypothetical protein